MHNFTLPDGSNLAEYWNNKEVSSPISTCRSAESLTTRTFDLPLLLTASPYIAHCTGACSAKGS